MHRRDLLRLLGAAGAGAALPSVLAACARQQAPAGDTASAASGDTATAGAGATPIGIQLYTVRELMAKDVEGTLAALAAIGYREVELAGLHGRTAAEFRAILDRNGLRAPSSHIPIERLRDDLPRVLDEAATLGNRYIVAPWLAEGERTADGYERVAATLNAAGEKALAAGMRVGYHNHDFEFAPLGGTRGEDILLTETDPSKVWFELDLFWATKAGAKPLELFERWPGRFPLVHVKDMDAGGNMVDVGAGTIDFAGIHEARARAGIEHWIVEHDNPADPIASARASFGRLRRIVT